jgi:hypothetical protein
MELERITGPDAPINKSSMGLSWFRSYSAIDCLQAPQGGTGFLKESSLGLAVMAIFKMRLPG